MQNTDYQAQQIENQLKNYQEQDYQQFFQQLANEQKNQEKNEPDMGIIHQTQTAITNQQNQQEYHDPMDIQLQMNSNFNPESVDLKGQLAQMQDKLISEKEQKKNQPIGTMTQSVQIVDALILNKMMRYPSIFIKQKPQKSEGNNFLESCIKFKVYGKNSENEAQLSQSKKKDHRLFSISEKIKFVQKCCLSTTCRAFKGIGYHEGERDGEQCLLFEKEFELSCLGLNRPILQLFVTENKTKKYIGQIKYPYSFMGHTLKIEDENDNEIYHIYGKPFQIGMWCGRFSFSTPCKNAEFTISDPKGQVLSMIHKKQSQCFSSNYSEDENLCLNFPENCSKKQRALLLASAIFIDYLFFEGR